MQGKSKKGVSVCIATLNNVTLGVVLHMISNCVAVSAHARLVGCCTRVAAAYAALCMVVYYVTVTVHAMSCTIFGMLSQFGCLHARCSSCCNTALPKFPEAKSRGLLDLCLLFSFPKGKLKRIFVLFELC